MELIEEIKSLRCEKSAAHVACFFKTGKGEYGEGDKFFGAKTPDLKKIIKKYYKQTTLEEIDVIIKNEYHEIRSAALSIMVLKYPKTSPEEQKKLYELYLKNVNYINNWDLVDISAQYIVGPYVFPDTEKLWELAKSGHLWSERIAMISTLYFIRQGEFNATTVLAEHFLTHKHDLIHKASGWMLREMGKRDIKPLYEFLDKFHKQMPRTMLRYSIEKLTTDKRSFYLAKS